MLFQRRDDAPDQAAGDIPKSKVDELGIIVSVWLNPIVATIEDLDHKILFDIHRKATSAEHIPIDAACNDCR